jgi:hypothetical protein
VASKKAPPPPICLSCGGTGAEPFKPLGPFFAGLKARTRDILEAHLPARRTVLEVIDRDIARQTVTTAKLIEKQELSLADILGEALLRLEKATGDYMEGHEPKAMAQLIAVASHVVFVLESYEAEQTAKRQVEDKR